MLKHRVQTVPVPSAALGTGSHHVTQQNPQPGTGHYHIAQQNVQSDTVSYPVTQQNIQPGISYPPDIQINAPSGDKTHPNDRFETPPTSGEYYGTQTQQPFSYHTQPVVNKAQYNTQQIKDHDRQRHTSDASPSHVMDNSDYTPASTGSSLRFNSQECSKPSSIPLQDAEEGVRIITEKYDSLTKLSASPQRSPMGSPSSDGGSFSFVDMIMSQKFREGVTEQDLLQVDTFYRSHKSEVYVCGCLVNMYFGTSKAALNNDQWTFSRTGIPLLLLDTGEHHRERKLYIILAEKGTGFTIWRDVIDSQTGYRTPNANFHTMHTSTDYSKLAGFSFDDAGAASEFYGHLHKLTADPDDDLLQKGNIKKKKSIKEKKKKVKLPKKTEISQPCCFVHVTKLDRPMTEDSESTSSSKNSNHTEISAPFNFQHVTAPSGTRSDVSNLMGSKLTLTSTSSVDSGLSDDRGSSKTGT